MTWRKFQTPLAQTIDYRLPAVTGNLRVSRVVRYGGREPQYPPTRADILIGRRVKRERYLCPTRYSAGIDNHRNCAG